LNAIQIKRSAVNRKFCKNTILNKGWFAFHLSEWIIDVESWHHTLFIHKILIHVNTILIHHYAKLFSIENPFKPQKAKMWARRVHKLRWLINPPMHYQAANKRKCINNFIVSGVIPQSATRQYTSHYFLMDVVSESREAKALLSLIISFYLCY
jgi:hypothetical protein